MAGTNKETTITTKVSHWTKFLVGKAIGYAPNSDGNTPTQNDFMAASIALRAMAILKNAGEYDLVKKNYEDLFGPAEEIIDRSDVVMAEVENGEEVEAAKDSYFEEVKEG